MYDLEELRFVLRIVHKDFDKNVTGLKGTRNGGEGIEKMQ